MACTVGRAAGTWSVLTVPHASNQVGHIQGLAADDAGHVYASDVDTDQVIRIDPDGSGVVLASRGSEPGQVRVPMGLALDASGALYVADMGNSRVQERDPDGTWMDIAWPGSGPGQVLMPAGLALDVQGNLYVADMGNNRIQKRDLQGFWSTFVPPNGGAGTWGISRPTVIAFDAADRFFLAAGGAVNLDYAGRFFVEHKGGTLEERAPGGNWSLQTPAISGLDTTDSDNLLAINLAADAAGDLYVVMNWDRIVKRDAQGSWSLVDTTELPQPSGLPSAMPTNGFFGWPPPFNQRGYISPLLAIAVTPGGRLYAARDRIWRQDGPGRWTEVAGRADAPGQVILPKSVAVDGSGTVYIADAGNHRIQKRDSQGRWSPVTPPAVQSPPFTPFFVGVDACNRLYMADYVGSYSDSGFQVLRREADGNWTPLHSGGGLAVVAVDPAGRLVLGVTAGGLVGELERQDSQGNWSVVARTGQSERNLGYMNLLSSLAVDVVGNLYVGDSYQSIISEWDPQGHGMTIGPSVPGTGAKPAGLALDVAGDLYATDATYSLLKRDIQNQWTTITADDSEIGPLYEPTGLTVDGNGQVYIADTGNDRVVVYNPVANPPAYGDLNGDGRVDVGDAIIALQLAVDPAHSWPPDQLQQADVFPRHSDGTFGDGTINLLDALRILRRALGLEPDPWP